MNRSKLTDAEVRDFLQDCHDALMEHEDTAVRMLSEAGHDQQVEFTIKVCLQRRPRVFFGSAK